MNPLIVLRGGGDLASGVAVRLFRAGFKVVILELDKPLAVRRGVAFSEAVYEDAKVIEGITARLVSPDQLQVAQESGEIPVLKDANANILRNQFLTSPQSTILVDARLLKTSAEYLDINLPLHIGLGPGFTAGDTCTAVIETRRGHTLGRVYWEGASLPDTGKPDGDVRRVLRAPADGVILEKASIGDHLKEGQVVLEIQGSDGKVHKVKSPFSGVLRGLIRSGLEVTQDMKLGDVDQRDDASACFLVSDKALAVGGGVLEAILTRYPIGTYDDPNA